VGRRQSSEVDSAIWHIEREQRPYRPGDHEIVWLALKGPGATERNVNVGGLLA